MARGLSDLFIEFFLNYYMLATLLIADILGFVYLVSKKDLGKSRRKALWIILTILSALITVLLVLALAFSRPHPGAQPSPQPLSLTISSPTSL